MPSYRLLWNVSPALSLPPDTIVIYDIKGNHKDGRNAGHLDGHVKWYDEAAFKSALARSRETVKAAIATAKKQGKKIWIEMTDVAAFYNDRPAPEE